MNATDVSFKQILKALLSASSPQFFAYAQVSGIWVCSEQSLQHTHFRILFHLFMFIHAYVLILVLSPLRSCHWLFRSRVLIACTCFVFTFWFISVFKPLCAFFLCKVYVHCTYVLSTLSLLSTILFLTLCADRLTCAWILFWLFWTIYFASAYIYITWHQVCQHLQ